MQIDYLANHQGLVPQITDWFFAEWSYLYPDRTRDHFEDLIRGRANIDRLPMTLVSFESGTLTGTVCLKLHDMESRLELAPWLAGLYVAGSWRGKGIGTKLMDAIEEEARGLGFKDLFLYTPVSESFYLRKGWQVVDRTWYGGSPVTLMEKNICG